MKGCSTTFSIGKVYAVEWIDHFSSDRLTVEKAAGLSPMFIKSFGICIGQNKDYLILSWHYEGNDGGNNSSMHILKVGIKKARELK